MPELSQTTVEDPLAAAARVWPDAVAVLAPGRTLTFGELDRLVTAAASRMRAPAGARVALSMDNGWPLVVLLIAALRARVVACPLSTRVPPNGVEDLLKTLGTRMLVTDASWAEDNVDADVLSPATLLAPGGARTSTAPGLDLEQPAIAVFTSGSTGRPKAALHRLRSLYFNARGSNENIRLQPGDRWLLALPLYHVGGLGILFRCLLAGATCVLPRRGEALGEVIRQHHITHVSLVATQLRRLLQEENEGLDRLRAILLGGSAIPTSLLRRAVGRGLPVFTTYGLTEMASQVTTTPPGASAEQLSTSGRVLPYRALLVADDGELLVRGEALFAGYLEAGEVRSAVDEDGWYHTGDLGTLDADGYLHVTGRKDHLFISGGENIQPEEIEQALTRLDGIDQAVVVPVPDEEFGHRPVAFVRGGDTEPSVVREALEAVLPRFKVPVAFYLWPEETSPGMKVDRDDFARRACELSGKR